MVENYSLKISLHALGTKKKINCSKNISSQKHVNLHKNISEGEFQIYYACETKKKSLDQYQVGCTTKASQKTVRMKFLQKTAIGLAEGF